MEATQIEQLKQLDLASFINAIKEMEGQDLMAALETQKTSALFAMSEDTVNLKVTTRYNIAKVINQRMKKELIEPFRELRDKEEQEEQKAAAAKNEERKKYAVEIDAVFTEAVRNQVLDIGRRYLEADLGTIVDIGLVVKRDAESKEIKLHYSSTLMKERVKGSGTTGRSPRAGGTKRSVTVQGGDTEKGATQVLAEAKHYNSFADGVRDLQPKGSPVTDKDWEGFNAKRFLESKGYVCEYVDAPTAQAAPEAAAAGAAAGVTEQPEPQPVA